MSVLALVGTGVFALAAIFSHQAMLGTLALVAVVICGLAEGVVEYAGGIAFGLPALGLADPAPAFALIWTGATGYKILTLLDRL